MLKNVSRNSRILFNLQQQCSRNIRGTAGTAVLQLDAPTYSINSGIHAPHRPIIVQVRSLSSGWSLSRNSRKARHAEAQLRQRRPLVNGKTVAFHMSELEPQSRLSAKAKSSSNSRSRQYDSDLIVVLDMDECIIHSQFFNNPAGANIYAHQVARAQQRNNNADGEQQQEVDSFRFSLPDGDIVHVNKRPYLDEFLNAVSSKYETHIFTAAMELYASPLLDILDPDGTKFAKRWYRGDCTFDPKTRAYVKNLNSLPLVKESNSSHCNENVPHKPHDLKRVVLVDNNPLSFLSNPSNGILVSSFFNDASDNTLPAVVELLDELDLLEDVRPSLDSRFGLKDALAEIRGGASMNERVVGIDNVEAEEDAVAF